MNRSALAFVLLCVACDGDDPPRPATDAGADVEAGPAAAWRTVLSELDGTLLSVWGSSERDVWAVGGPLGNAGFESLVVRFDGTVWRRLKPGKSESFWWVHGTGPSDVWLVGEKGRVTHWDGAAFTEVPSGTDATLFGVWAAAPNDVWAVGGTPESATGANDVVLHWDGATWKLEAPPAQKVAFYKVWGSSPSDLYVVGEAGVIWHRVQNAWKREGEGVATGRLTTVFGCSATEVYAVGGRDLLVSDGATWRRAEIDPLLVLNDLNGVSCGRGGVVVVGGGSLKLRLVTRSDGTRGWETDFGSEPLVDLHGAWADPTGAFWGAGGQFTAAPRPNTKRQGALARYAPDAISPLLVP
ncbi:MAG: hypothetical protein KIT84_05810 [Labilithrix sp.]|nr:hypothetical protein [Labilithrix sp.]MCW5810505.1 hypothetical protein [Labilithrix sp.]